MKLSVTTCSRRAFLKLATSSTLITMMSTFSVGCNQDKNDLESVAQRMIKALNHPGRAREIGAMYIAQAPGFQGQSFGQLAEKILIMLEIDPENISDETLATLEARLSEQVRRDFVDENVVIVQGWMLSRTELMLCSLAATHT